MSHRPSVVVLNGSPKGAVSVTQQYVRWLVKVRPDVDFHVVHAAQRIEHVEKDETEAKEILERLRKADLVLFAAPVYICLVPSQFQRFIEWLLAQEPRCRPRAAVLLTSIHFNDHLARAYLEDVIREVKWTHAGSFCSGMHDLLHPKWRHQLVVFLAHALEPAPAIPSEFDKKVLVVREKADAGAKPLVEAFCEEFPKGAKPELVALEDFGLEKGCHGCLRCGTANICAQSDGEHLVEECAKVQEADALVVMASLERGMPNWRWKQLVDRLFHNNHDPMFEKKAMGFAFMGALEEGATLRAMLRGYVEYGSAQLIGIAAAKGGKDAVELARGLARETARTTSDGYRAPPTFESIGARKVIRDAVWGGLRRVYPREHARWNASGFYDFPRYGLRQRLRDAAFWLPGRRDRYQSSLVQRMVEPFRQLFD